MRATAQVFMSGSSQAVRLPKAFRLEGAEVRVSRVGDGLLLTPIRADMREIYARIDSIGGGWPARPAQGRHRRRKSF
jgi:antitoxin VapB